MTSSRFRIVDRLEQQDTRMDSLKDSLPGLSFPSALVMQMIQSITVRYAPRGLPRLIWLSHRFTIGTGMRIVWYKRQFRVICDCDSYDSLMIVSGFVLRSMERLLKELIDDIEGSLVFVDVGANIGFVSLLACTMAAEKGQVLAYCFEPDPRAFQLLTVNSSLNSCHMNLVNMALGDAPGSATMNLAGESPRSTLLPEPPGGFSFIKTVGQHQVDVITLDAFCSKQGVVPDIIKIDVEGFEPYVLQGASRIIEQSLPYLIFEINPATLAVNGNSLAGLLEWVRRLGYQVFHVDFKQAGLNHKQVHRRHNWRGYVEVDSSDDNKGCFFDVFAVPRDRLSKRTVL
jgi:FkbM family methyltransferase